MVLALRSTCTTRSLSTHWARSLSGVQMQTFWTRLSEAALAPLEERQHALQDADHCAEGPILALVESTQAIEVPEQLVRTVDQMDRGRAVRVCCRSGRCSHR